ncbi:eukaryotic translation initiation factor 3 subunit G [Trifolium repens]|nr:eukaryotic translation initiation factor 3 subunit G [Trifolium repens]
MVNQIEQPKMRWGELEEDDGENLDFLLPPRAVIGPDENGIKKVIEYKFDDDGNKVKITTTTRTRKLANARISKRAVERRSLPKFGDAVNEDVGSRLTMVSTEEIVLERPKPIGSQKEVAMPDPKVGAVIMQCRICLKKGEHWTAKCPLKDISQPPEVFVDNDMPVISNGSGSNPGKYVPPSKKPGADKTRVPQQKDENSVRVTNLSEDTTEPDLHELFRPFGSISRVYVAIDKTTHMSRGFGFVSFVSREDAQRAINKLNGYGYDNLILKVEWAAPRTT